VPMTRDRAEPSIIPTKSPADSEMMSPGWRAPCWH
jgi:hypothetical protein